MTDWLFLRNTDLRVRISVLHGPGQTSQYSDWYYPPLEQNPFITSDTTQVAPYNEENLPAISTHPLTQEYVDMLTERPGDPVHSPMYFGCETYDVGMLLDATTGFLPLQDQLDSPEFEGKHVLVLLSEALGAISIYNRIWINGSAKSVTLAGIGSLFGNETDTSESGSTVELLQPLIENELTVEDDGSTELYQLAPDTELEPGSGSSGSIGPDISGSGATGDSGSDGIPDITFFDESLDTRGLTTVTVKGSGWRGGAVIECRGGATLKLLNMNFREELGESGLPRAFIRCYGSKGVVLNSVFDSRGKFDHVRGDTRSVIYYRNVFKCDATSTLARTTCLVVHPRVICNPALGSSCQYRLDGKQQTLTCEGMDTSTSITPSRVLANVSSILAAPLSMASMLLPSPSGTMNTVMNSMLPSTPSTSSAMNMTMEDVLLPTPSGAMNSTMDEVVGEGSVLPLVLGFFAMTGWATVITGVELRNIYNGEQTYTMMFLKACSKIPGRLSSRKVKAGSDP
ncbi:hypothetical protein [Spongorhabdus nitratireducens]